MACPLCKSQQFYVKDVDDEYEVHEFETGEQGITFSEAEDAPDVTAEQEIFCCRCSWHGRLDEVS